MRLLTGVTRLVEAGDADRFGGKAAQLAAALSAGLPVPDGWALDGEAVEALALGRPSASGVEAAVREAVAGCGPVAVRSSAFGEDSERASFAGAHLTLLGRLGGDAVVSAVREVHASGTGSGALAYRDRLCLDPVPRTGVPRMGVVVQQMVDADVAGVLFTRHPVTQADEIVVEASWGLGEAVVAGLVTPDHVRLSRDGRVLQHVVGDKDLAIRLTAHGGTVETPVPASLAAAPCLGDRELAALLELVGLCDEVYGGHAHDVEFAFSSRSGLHLLQRRPITHA